MSEKTIYIAPSVLIMESAMGDLISGTNVTGTTTITSYTTDDWIYEYDNGEWHRRTKLTGAARFDVAFEKF